MSGPSSQVRAGGLIAWFASNPVAANLLMALIICAGAGSLLFMDREVFPRFLPNQIEILAHYPGAGALEVEDAVCVRIEEAIHDLPGIKRLRSEISDQGDCNVNVAVLPDHNVNEMINSLRGRVQAIPRMPKALEPIVVQRLVREGDDGVIWVALHGRTDPMNLKALAERVEVELGRVPGVTQVYNYFPTPYEIAVEVSADKLRQFNLSLQEVADAMRRASLDLPGGLVKGEAGELLLRVQGRARDALAVGNLILRTHPDGSRLLLRDVATVNDGLQERMADWRHNGEPAQGWEVHGSHDEVEVARRVKAYAADLQTRLPEGMSLTTWWDDSQAYEERTRTLIEDGLGGFLLVCLVLTLFLSLRVALWAGLGILTSVFGAFALMPLLGLSMNMLSLFGFLLAMGILVDDAIIIGEAVHTEQTGEGGADTPPFGAVQLRAHCLAAAIRGTQNVALPVVLAVLVVLVAFLPGLFVPGWAGEMMRPICLVMILTLVFSLVEALLILPAHLASPTELRPRSTRLSRLRGALNRALGRFIHALYRRLLERALAWRWLSLSGFAVLLMLSLALVLGGHVRHSLRADVTRDSFWVNLKLPQDVPYAETRRLAEKVEKALFELRDELDRQGGGGRSVIVGLESILWEHGGGFWTELSPEGRQRIVVDDFVREWRRRIGDIGRAKIDFLVKEGDVPYDIEFDLGASDPAKVHEAAEELKRSLASYPGVYDVIDSAEPGKPEIHLQLKPAAERLGLRLEGLAEQVRQAYFGEAVHRLQRGRSEVKVLVRLPRGERRSLDDLKRLPVSLPGGGLAPLESLAGIELRPGYSKLVRQDRQRVLKVQARVDPALADVNAIYERLETAELPRLKQRYPGLNADIGEEREDELTSLRALGFNTLISLLLIYALIAIPFRSYSKPFIFLLAAPVAWSGAVLAHWLAGLPLSMESLVGMIAASGVVVNDSLVLLDYIKEREIQGDDAAGVCELIVEACTARFRPILLAFLTNFAGFLPTLLETSEQARFLIPMTLSLSAGLLVGMAASLILAPVAYATLAGGDRMRWGSQDRALLNKRT
ncbi:efflux RND transporter permease subunit [Methyloterricola oryzae]|uniref:efflux RND transporter permease subunit n=1 Tax=Methyloterricola oryzae TaxID=1495050 RepID=UPI0005EB7CBB|nr:efflux RND transporter permease subunit [Methyloterricola oryzae]